MKVLTNFIYERLKINKNTKMTSNGIIELYNMSDGNFNYGSVDIHIDKNNFESNSSNEHINILNCLKIIIDNIEYKLLKSIAIKFKGNMWHICSRFSVYDDKELKKDAFVGNINTYNYNHDRLLEGIGVEFKSPYGDLLDIPEEKEDIYYAFKDFIGKINEKFKI